MAVKLADTLAPMGEFPIANAKDIDFDDGESLQEKLDNGTLGGGGGASTADAVEYINDTIGSNNVEEALNTVIADLHTHDNKDVLDLLSENEEGKLQYNGVIIGGDGGASTADAVTYENAGVDTEIDNVKEALDKLFNKVYYVAPSVTSFTATPNGGIFEVGHVVSAPITFNWSYNKDITTQTLTDCTLTDEIVRTATYNTDIATDKTFTLNASDGENAVSKSISYKFVYPYYYGVSDTDILDESGITALTKDVSVKGAKTYSYVTNQNYMVFAYDSSYGNIRLITDKNGFDVTGSFTKNTVSIGSKDYYVYVSNKCSGSYSMKFSF